MEKENVKIPINAFPGYKFVLCGEDKKPHNIYRGTDVGMGGYVYFEPGMYENVALIDVASMHPHSIIAMNCFGDYTKNYKELINIRIAIKHKEFDKARKMLGGKLDKYLKNEDDADALSKALKLPINGAYGLTAANFDNPMRDVRNKNNIVALRGALFMRTLQDEVVKRGFTVAHIKTDSLKIPNATTEIIDFCMEFAKTYGYTFEHEATYDRMCLVNGSTYVAKYATQEKCKKLYGYIPGDNQKHGNEWTSVAAQFSQPYVFKKLFSKEPIVFSDLCETKSVSSSLYLDMNEGFPNVEILEKELSERYKPAEKARLNPEFDKMSEEDLLNEIAKGHNYIFIGRVGSFCPIKPGCGGGLLMREKDGKYYAATGSKGYRWLESEMVQSLGKEDDIDRSYYDNLVNAAADAISEFGDLEWFVS